MVSPQCFSILGPIPSLPVDLFMSNLSIIFLTWKGVINEMLNSESRKIEFSLSFSDGKFCSWNSTLLTRFDTFTNWYRSYIEVCIYCTMRPAYSKITILNCELYVCICLIIPIFELQHNYCVWFFLVNKRQSEWMKRERDKNDFLKLIMWKMSCFFVHVKYSVGRCGFPNHTQNYYVRP